MTSDCFNTETKPLDMVDPATENAARNIVKNKKEHVRDPSPKVTVQDSSWKIKKNKKEPERDPSVRELVQDGWSAPVIQSFEDFPLVEPGVCLVSRRQAAEAILEWRSQKGLAFLTTKNIFGAFEVELEVKTAQGQSAMWKRYLVQLGSTFQRHKVGT